MAQFLTILALLTLFAVFNPVVCPSGQMYNERRDRAPYIGSGEPSPQYLGDLAETNGGRSKKTPALKDINASRQDQERLASSPNDNEGSTTDSVVDKNIRTVFSTNFGPGLYLFKNTAPFFNRPYSNSYADQMVGDQPDPDPLTSSTLARDREFFKVQRSPDGKLSLVYNEDYIPINKTDRTSYIADNKSSNSNKESFENRFQTHHSGGPPLAKETSALSSINHNRKKDFAIRFPTEEPEKGDNTYTVDSNDCVEKDGAANGKPFCTNLRNYPERTHLEQIIKQRFSNLESFFGEDLVLPQNISQRMNNEPNEEFLCKSRTRVIYPQAGLNKDYNWLIIVNIPNYKQGIRIEECINEGSQCGESNGLSLPNRYTATCKQSYIYRSLVAYTNDTVIKDQFKMPSCCKCVLRTG